MKLQTKVAKWGNSLALHLTKEMLEGAGLKQGDRVTITTYENGSIVIRRALP